MHERGLEMRNALFAIAGAFLLCSESLAYPKLGDGGKVDGSMKLSIAASSELQYVLPELNKAFSKANPDIQVKATLGSSGALFSQLSAKAPFDIFLSSGGELPKKLVEKGLARKDSLFKFAACPLVLWAPKGSDIDVAGQGAKALLDPTVIKVSLPSPAQEPSGRAAEAALKGLGVYDEVKPRLLLAESSLQAAQSVEARSADLGVLPKPLLFAPGMKEGKVWDFPLDASPALEQTGVALSWSKSSRAVEAYRSFLLSEEAKAIFKAYGFSTP